MATQSPLLTDPAKINPAGAEPSDIEAYQKALQDSLSALENRYSQPNWYKVAAGFAKPQLGGFLASLGSASEALGENLEQQREQQLPISQLRAQLAQSKIGMGQNQKAADLYANHLRSGKPVDDNLVGELTRIAPDSPSTKAAIAQLATQQKNVELESSKNSILNQQNQLELQGIQNQRELAHERHNSGRISNAEYSAILDNLSERSNRLNTSGQAKQNKPEFQNIKQEDANRQESFPTVEHGPIPSGMPMPSVGGINLPSVSSKVTKQEPYQHVVQALTPSGEPEDVFKSLAEQRRMTAKDEEDRTNALLKPYYLASDPTIYNNYNKAKNEILTLSKQDPVGFSEIHNLTREGGPLAAAAKKGLVAHFGSLNANFSLPVDDYRRAGLDPKYWGLADRVLSDYSVLANIHMKLEGNDKFDPTDNNDMGKLIKFAHINRTPDEAIYTVKDNGADFDMQAKIGKTIPQLMKEIQRLHKDELAPRTAAYQSSVIEKIKNDYQLLRDLEQKKYQSARQSYLNNNAPR
jgi:hypothetical protein